DRLHLRRDVGLRDAVAGSGGTTPADQVAREEADVAAQEVGGDRLRRRPLRGGEDDRRHRGRAPRGPGPGGAGLDRGGGGGGRDGAGGDGGHGQEGGDAESHGPPFGRDGRQDNRPVRARSPRDAIVRTISRAV